MNPRIITKSVPHSLRAVSVATFPPGFLLLLIHGIAADRVNPAIGLLPLFVSSAYSGLLLAHEKRCGCQNSGLSGTPLHLICDMLLGVGLLVCLILAWVNVPGDWSGSLIMLATYGTNFLITNFLIHLFFVAQQIWESLTPGAHYVQSCPQCQFGPFEAIPRAARGYAPLLDGNGRPNGGEAHEEDGANGEESAV
ncbi:hypothetical protein EJ04DRAFT_534003 [Polyplosphaeria fusca]|uniref:Uncharacterized protein n=1 Tax=Polyplosphaeria fusca TaxID=682080 RepID=A0A9P4V2R4_9PLEO|nr:hypothetical protein EJ04DRAFT_534003 [Polyplosphaeria fusca]